MEYEVKIIVDHDSGCLFAEREDGELALIKSDKNGYVYANFIKELKQNDF